MNALGYSVAPLRYRRADYGAPQTTGEAVLVMSSSQATSTTADFNEVPPSSNGIRDFESGKWESDRISLGRRLPQCARGKPGRERLGERFIILLLREAGRAGVLIGRSNNYNPGQVGRCGR